MLPEPSPVVNSQFTQPGVPVVPSTPTAGVLPNHLFLRHLSGETKFFTYQMAPDTRCPEKIWSKKPKYASADGRLEGGLRSAIEAERAVSYAGAVQLASFVPDSGDYFYNLDRHRNPETKDLTPIAAAWISEYKGRLVPGHTLGYYFTTDSQRFLYDLDGCRNPETGELTEKAHEAIAIFKPAGAYMEVSPSGTGIHIVGRYVGERPVHETEDNQGFNLELYTGGRGMAIGTPYEGTGSPDADCTLVLECLIASYFPKRSVDRIQVDPSTMGDLGPADIEEGLRYLQSACSEFESAELWNNARNKLFIIAGGLVARGVLTDEEAWVKVSALDRMQTYLEEEGETVIVEHWNRCMVDAEATPWAAPIDRAQAAGFGHDPLPPGISLTPPPPPAMAPGFELQRLSLVTPKNVTWLWKTWLPKGMFALFAGPGGVGKSTVTLSWASVVSRGGQWPDGTKCEKPGKVLIWSGEDDTATTIVPRLMAMGADLDNIQVIKGRRTIAGEPIPFDPARDFPGLCKHVKEEGVSLLVVDPIVSAVSGDMNKSNEVRRGLQDVVNFAEDLDCCVVGITHFAKNSSGKNPTDRVIGSQAFSAFARMVLVSQKDEDNGECVLVRSKSNISVDRGGFRYKIEPTVVAGGIETTRCHWLAASEGSARELLDEVEPADEGRTSRGKLDAARDFLSIALSKGPRPIKVLETGSGFSFRTLSRAKKEAGVQSEKRPDGWYWYIPFPPSSAASVGLHQVIQPDGKLALVPEINGTLSNLCN